MTSDKINIPEPVQDIIESLHPNERSLVAGVFALLGDDLWRDTHKRYFGLIHDEETWAIAESRVTVAFIEENDGSITIMYVNMRSKMHPSWL